MRTFIRAVATSSAVLTLTAVTALTALAGSYAEVGMIDPDAPPPVAGEEREVRFTLLQHGVTPVEGGIVTVTATLPGSDLAIRTRATSAGNGEWLATVVFPVDGDWQLRVTHSVFETPAAETYVVGTAGTSIGGVVAIGGVLAAAVLLLAAALAVGRVHRGRRPMPSADPVKAG
jgi:hypothetical protein